MDMQDEEANNSENEGADDTPKGNIKSLLDLEEDESSSGEKRVDMKRRVELKENSV